MGIKWVTIHGMGPGVEGKHDPQAIISLCSALEDQEKLIRQSDERREVRAEKNVQVLAEREEGNYQ